MQVTNKDLLAMIGEQQMRIRMLEQENAQLRSQLDELDPVIGEETKDEEGRVG